MIKAARGARSGVILHIFSLLLPAALAAAPAYADTPEDLFRQGHFFGELRYRYEHVDKDGFAKDARAHTVRADLGFETGLYRDFTALADFQAVRHIGDDDFNDTENSNTTFPIIADPDKAQFRQAWLMWTGLPNMMLRGGRQEITFDNQRFVGNVDFRQNDQTFDAGTERERGRAMTLKKIKNFSETREAAAFADAIEHRASGAALFAPPAQHWAGPALKSPVIVA